MHSRLTYRLATTNPVMNKMTTTGNHTMRSHLLGVKMWASTATPQYATTTQISV